MLRASLVLLQTAIATTAMAHEDGSLHSHPHLLISNEFLTALLLGSAIALIATARRLLVRGQK